MPSIEVISLNSESLNLDQNNFGFAIIEENEKIESHRSLFYDFLKNLTGVIVHIGNPEMIFEKENGFFAGKLIDWKFNEENKFKFLDKYDADFLKLLKIAQEKSPKKIIYFLTDYQFAENNSQEMFNLTLENFINNYKENGLEFNKIYKLEN